MQARRRGHDVQAARDKAEPLAGNGRAVCVVIAAFTPGTQMQRAFCDGDAMKLVASSGKWAIRDEGLERWAGAPVAADAEAVLRVHDNMQLIVLCAAGLCSLFGRESVAAIGELIASRRDAPVVSSLQLSEALLLRSGINPSHPIGHSDERRSAR